MVAGEASGDLLASVLLRGMSTHQTSWKAAGIGGRHMGKAGFEAWWPSDRLAVRGYVEVLRHYRGIVAIRDKLRQRLTNHRPDLFVGVDAPDFNLALERDLKGQGVPTMHLVCPSVWAWRPERIEKLKASADHVLCIFPFEPELLARHGIPATYIGHPLAPLIPMFPDRLAARKELGLPEYGTVVALLPGSRESEVRYLASRFFEAATLVLRENPAIHFVLPAVPNLKIQIDELAERSGLGESLTVLEGRSHTALAACDVTLIASGTATLEAALFKRPMVIAYNMNWLSWQMMRRKRLQPWVGLPNILCQDFVVPELLQDRATPQAMAREVLAWLGNPQRVQEAQRRFASLHQELSRDTVGLSLQVMEQLMSHGRHHP